MTNLPPVPPIPSGLPTMPHSTSTPDPRDPSPEPRPAKESDSTGSDSPQAASDASTPADDAVSTEPDSRPSGPEAAASADEPDSRPSAPETAAPADEADPEPTPDTADPADPATETDVAVPPSPASSPGAAVTGSLPAMPPLAASPAPPTPAGPRRFSPAPARMVRRPKHPRQSPATHPDPTQTRIPPTPPTGQPVPPTAPTRHPAPPTVATRPTVLAAASPIPGAFLVAPAVGADRAPTPPARHPAPTPRRPKPQAAATAGRTPGRTLPLTALVLGALAVVGAFVPYLNYATWFIGIVGMALGVIALLRRTRGRGLAVSGTILSGIGFLLSVILAAVYTIGFVTAWGQAETGGTGASVTTPEVATETIPAVYGQTVTYDDGLQLQVSAPTTFEPSSDARGADQSWNLSFTVTLYNGSGAAVALEPALAVFSNGTAGSPVIDPQNGLDGSAPSGTIGVGETRSWVIGSSVANPADVAVQIAPAAAYLASTFTN